MYAKPIKEDGTRPINFTVPEKIYIALKVFCAHKRKSLKDVLIDMILTYFDTYGVK